MLVLVIDTSSAAVIAALAEVTDDAVRGLAHRDTVSPRGHTELLTPSIAACLAEAGASPTDLGAIVAGLGPGPFTGLRVGLITAAATVQALGVPGYGVCSLDAIAGAYSDGAGWSSRDAEAERRSSRDAEAERRSSRDAEAEPGPLLVVTDARRKEVYWASYRDGARVGGPAVCRPEQLPAGRAATGAGADLYAEVLRARGMPVLGQQYPSPWALAHGAADRIRAGAPAEPLVPLYLRRPDAVPGPPKPVRR